jgi:hypothetical protein
MRKRTIANEPRDAAKKNACGDEDSPTSRTLGCRMCRNGRFDVAQKEVLSARAKIMGGRRIVEFRNRAK